MPSSSTPHPTTLLRAFTPSYSLTSPFLFLLILLATCKCFDGALGGAPGEGVPEVTPVGSATTNGTTQTLPHRGDAGVGERTAGKGEKDPGGGDPSDNQMPAVEAAVVAASAAREAERRRAAVAGSSSGSASRDSKPRGPPAETATAATGRGRRRHTDTAEYASRTQQWARPQAHSSQHTMSQTLYDHFRPLDPELPSGDILPFLQFGMKLPSVIGSNPPRTKTHQWPSPATTPVPHTTTFPGASTNALIEEEQEENDSNEMKSSGEEGPGGSRLRVQSHTTKQASKLKAAILLQMMVNNVRRKKLALERNATGIRKEEGEVVPRKEMGRRRTTDLTSTGGVRDRGGIGREENRGSNVEVDVEEGKGSAEVKEEDVKEGLGEDKVDNGHSNKKESKVGPEVVVPEQSMVEGKLDIEEKESVKDILDDGKDGERKKSNEGVEEGLGVVGEVVGEEKKMDGGQVGEELKERVSENSGRKDVKVGEMDTPKEYVDEEGALPPNSKRRVVLVSRRRKKNNEHEAEKTSMDSNPQMAVSSEVVQNDEPLRLAMGQLRSIPSLDESKKVQPMEWRLAPPPVSEMHEAEEVVEKKSDATSLSTQNPIPPSTSTTGTTPIVSSNSPSITSTTPFESTVKSTTVVAQSTQTTPSTQPTPRSTSSTMPTSTKSVTISSPPPPTTSTFRSTTIITPSPLLTIIYNLSTTNKPLSSFTPPSRKPFHHPAEQPTRNPLVAHVGHPQIHPSLLIPVPHLLSPHFKTSTTNPVPSITRASTTSAPSVEIKKELPTKVDIDARDWVVVLPPNATTTTVATPSHAHTQKPVPSESSPPKPHPNGVEKGWVRVQPNPPAQPQNFQPYIPIEQHFSSQWHSVVPPNGQHITPHPTIPHHLPTTTAGTTVGREVLSVVTSVSVESSPEIRPLPSTASFNPSMTPTSEKVLTKKDHQSPMVASTTDIPSDSYASQFPRLVSVFVDEQETIENNLGADSERNGEPDVLAEAGMGPTATYILLSLAIVPGVVAIASAARCLLVHRQKSLYESETSSEVSCMGGRTLKSCSRGTHIPHSMDTEESGTIRQSSDVFRAITRLPRVAHLGWDHERRRRQGGGKDGRSDGGVLEGEEGPARDEQEGIDNPSKDVDEEISNWEFPRSKLRLQTLLGQGNFGQVWKAEADGICDGEGSTRLVAVKLVKAKEGDDGDEEVTVGEDPLAQQCTLAQPSAASSSRRPGEAMTVIEQCRRKRREEFMAELGIMQLLSPPHPNVVTLLGCCTSTEPPLLIMEYVMFGKLLTYLREHRSKRQYCNVSDDPEILTSRDLIVFAYCVVKGMEYLVSKGIVHRDLAARNILVDHNKTCKIADFGMSRCVRDTGGQVYEERQKQGALPVRWMAPESLFRGIFTLKSDVWSFGVLLWEIITLGSTPYPGIGARDVMRRVRDGRRLERPSHVRPEIFRVAARCWHRDSTLRPTFSRLRADLGPLLASASSGIGLNSGTGDSEMCLVPNRGNRRWRPPGPQIDLSRFEDDSY